MKLLRNVWDVVIGILREISDQNAYQRHLRVHCAAHSPEEWRRFMDERLSRKFGQAKCC